MKETDQIPRSTNPGKLAPPRPQEPDPSECCGRGCDPCIYDYYERALERWRRSVSDAETLNP